MRTKLYKFLAKRWRILTDEKYRDFRREVKLFFRERGRATPCDYIGMGSNSIVYDLGGYRGDWAATMRSRYDCYVHIFEPHPVFAKFISERFSDDDKVTVHPCALGATDGVLLLSDAADGSSAFSKGTSSVEGRVCSASTLLSSVGAKEVAAIKINIEGGEFDILPHLIETGDILKFTTITVQFHNFVPNAAERRTEIREHLSRTHQCKWCYDFVWEEWVALR